MSQVQHYRVNSQDNIPIVTSIVHWIKKVEGKKPLSEKRPAEYVALFNQGGSNYYVEDNNRQHIVEPWQSTKVIF